MQSLEKTGSVEIYGMPISGNVIPCVTFALDKGCGAFVFKDMMKGELKSPDMLKINPFGQMPSMKDGNFCLAESGAILRYLANTYAIDAYGGFDAKKRAEIDWVLDWQGTNFIDHFKKLWYSVAGFAPVPESYPEACTACCASLDTFATKFLTGKKFVGGATMSIADYKLGCWLWYLSHPVIKKKTGLQLPTRYVTYVEDYLAALSPASVTFLEAGKGFLDSKA
jgi:glutathione S-transferase